MLLLFNLVEKDHLVRSLDISSESGRMTTRTMKVVINKGGRGDY